MPMSRRRSSDSKPTSPVEAAGRVNVRCRPGSVLPGSLVCGIVSLKRQGGRHHHGGRMYIRTNRAARVCSQCGALNNYEDYTRPAYGTFDSLIHGVRCLICEHEKELEPLETNSISITYFFPWSVSLPE